MQGALAERVHALLHFESSDPDVLSALARALSALGEPSALGRLRELARPGKPKEVRMSALHALTAYPDDALREVLLDALADAEPDLAKEALNELGSTDGPDAAPDIARALLHPAAEVRRLAASWLGRIGDAESMSALTARLHEEPVQTRAEATHGEAAGQHGKRPARHSGDRPIRGRPALGYCRPLLRPGRRARRLEAPRPFLSRYGKTPAGGFVVRTST
jgi:HEAT repeat protein